MTRRTALALAALAVALPVAAADPTDLEGLWVQKTSYQGRDVAGGLYRIAADKDGKPKVTLEDDSPADPRAEVPLRFKSALDNGKALFAEAEVPTGRWTFTLRRAGPNQLKGEATVNGKKGGTPNTWERVAADDLAKVYADAKARHEVAAAAGQRDLGVLSFKVAGLQRQMDDQYRRQQEAEKKAPGKSGVPAVVPAHSAQMQLLVTEYQATEARMAKLSERHRRVVARLQKLGG